MAILATKKKHDEKVKAEWKTELRREAKIATE